jgi:hypothetical protein
MKCGNVLYAVYPGLMAAHSKYFSDLNDIDLCPKREEGKLAFASVDGFHFTPEDLNPFLYFIHGWCAMFSLLFDLRLISSIRQHEFTVTQQESLIHIANVWDCPNILQMSKTLLNRNRAFSPHKQIGMAAKYDWHDWISRPVTRILGCHPLMFEDSVCWE